MIKHIVLWRVKGDTSAEKKASALKIKQALEGLQGKIPGMLKIEAGINFAESAQSADIALYIEFASREALEHYNDHPEHELVKPLVLSLRNERRVVDYEVADV